MAITVTSLQAIVSTGASATYTSTMTSTHTITPNPLTTTFEPPSYCTQSYLSNCQTDTVSGTLPCFVSIYPQAVCDSNGQDCYPPVPGALDNSYIYSPGLVCPSGWSTVWKEVRTPSGADEETTAHCCPSGLTVTTYGIYSTWCEGTVTQGEETMIVNGLSECPSSTTAFSFGPGTDVQLDWVNVDSTAMSVSGDVVFTVSAEHIALLYKSTDMAAAGASATSGSDSGGSPGSSSGSSGAGGSSSSSGSGLSTGATAGIAIGAAAVGIAAILALFYLCIRRREADNRRRGLQVGSGPTYTSDNSHLPPSSAAAGAIPGMAYVPNGTEHELKANTPQVTHAAIGTTPATELQGSTPAASAYPGVWPQGGGGGGGHYGESTHGGARVPVMEEVAATNSYYQLPGTLDREKGMLGHSRQATPIDLVGNGYGRQ
ncbi:hypothetical protein VMCG_07279 [Cytospora schulzeri]|uniref:Uncharacterized protein n=1 Tax=Cytospora schulzeri TaxID=448051 RepID=A0A423WAC1_9PEZI|nr:hypothetical protein VMCG_07279 [Valsa malicola]